MLRRSLFLRCAVAAFACVTIAACSSGSDPTSARGSTDGTVKCGAKDAPPCVPIPTTRVLPSPCGDITAEFLTEALGRSFTATGSDATGCAFTAGDLTLRVGATVFDPYVSGITVQGQVPPGQYRVTNDRSGRWFAEGSLTANSLSYLWGIVSYGRGSDTYPPTDGPEQRPLVRDAAAAFVEAMTRVRPLD